MNISCTVREGDDGCHTESVNPLKIIAKTKQKNKNTKSVIKKVRMAARMFMTEEGCG